LASEQLKLEPTTENPLDIADRDERKSLSYWNSILKEKGLDETEENTFIAAACAEKGIEFLEGKTKVNVRKNNDENQYGNEEKTPKKDKVSTYTILLDGESYNVQVAAGADAETVSTLGKVQVSGIKKVKDKAGESESNTENVLAPVNGVVFKILCSPGDNVTPDQTVMVLESMKMEIEVKAGVSGSVVEIQVNQGENVEEGDVIINVS
jgi:pyruvate carboxylase subunit B